MGMFDNWVNKAKSGAQVAGQKAGELVEITKLTVELNEKNAGVTKLYTEMGQMVYDAYTNGDASTDQLNEKCAAVDALLAEAKVLKEKINQLKKVKICEKCGGENPSDNQYCAKCGDKLPETPKEEIVVEDYVVQEAAEPAEEPAPEAPAAEETKAE